MIEKKDMKLFEDLLYELILAAHSGDEKAMNDLSAIKRAIYNN